MRRRWTALLLAVLTGATTILALSAPEEARASTSGWAGIVLGAPCVPIDPDTDSPELVRAARGIPPGSSAYESATYYAIDREIRSGHVTGAPALTPLGHRVSQDSP